MPTSKQRREAERRRLQRQLGRRADRDVRRRRGLILLTVVNLLLAIGAVVGLLVATSGDDGNPEDKGKPKAVTSTTPRSSSPVAPSTPVANASAYPCTWKKTGTPSRPVQPPATTRPPRSGTVQAAVQTSRGQLVFTLDRADAPCAVESFLSLAKQKFFDDTPCHRLTTGPTLYVVQCGDPTGTGSGGPGYAFEDELTGHERYTKGVLAMANAGANTNGSKFFIVYADSELPPSYTIFGRVTKGLAVVANVAAKGATPAGDGKPNLSLRLLHIGGTE